MAKVHSVSGHSAPLDGALSDDGGGVWCCLQQRIDRFHFLIFGDIAARAQLGAQLVFTG